MSVTPEQQLLELQRQMADMTSIMQAQASALTQAQASLAQFQTQRATDLETVNRLQQQLLDRDGNLRKSKVQFVDVKGIGKPVSFQSDVKAWPNWSFKLGNFLEGIVSGIKSALEIVQDHDDPLTDEQLEGVQGCFEQDSDLKDISRQLYAVLAQLCEGEALDLVQSTSNNDGFEAWRVISRRFDPQGAGRRRNVMAGLIQPGSFDTGQLHSAIAKWEERVRVYERRAGHSLQDDVKASVLVEMTKGALKDHLLLNAKSLKTYIQVREEIQCYLESKFNSEPVPMDVGPLSRTRSSAGQQNCNNCGAPGHWKRDCWKPGGGAYNQNKGGKGKGKDYKGKDKGKYGGGKGDAHGKGKGKDYKGGGRGRGAGAGKGQEAFNGYCSLCWAWGHKRANCPQLQKGDGKGKPKGAGSLENAAPEQEAPALEGLDLATLELSTLDDRSSGEPSVFWATIDSGAACTVIPSGWFPGVELRPTASSELGATYRAANGSLVKDEGQKIISVRTEDGYLRRISCTSMKVHKMLLAVSKLVEKGHEVLFSPNGCHIKHLGTGHTLPVHLRQGVYAVKLESRSASSAASSSQELCGVSGGPRQAGL